MGRHIGTEDGHAVQAQGWLSVLRVSGVVRLLRPLRSNAVKRLAKAPKLYFTDTGLACHLLGWNTAQTLRRGAMAGHMFETFVVGEVVKSHLNAGGDARNVHFYRDARKREIDLVIQEGRVLHPVEIKTAATVNRAVAAGFSVLDDVGDYGVGAREPLRSEMIRMISWRARRPSGEGSIG